MVKERLKFFIRFKKSIDNTIQHAIAKQEKLDAIKTSYASINDQDFRDIFVDYERNSKIYWVKRGEFYNKYYNADIASQLDSSYRGSTPTNSISRSSDENHLGASTPQIEISSWSSLLKRSSKFKLTPHIVFRLVIVMILAFLCSIQCYSMINSYLEYPSSVNLFETIPTQLLDTLPGITICNNNRLSLSRLASRNSIVKEEIEKTFGIEWQNASYYTQAELDQYRDKLSKIFKRLGYNADNDVLGTNLNNQFNIKPDSSTYIKWLDCARSWVDTVECDQFKQIHSVQDRRCTTLFYEGVLYYNLMHRPDLFNSSRTTTSKYSYFDTKQVAKFILDFRPNDYGDLKRQIGSRIIFHSRKQVATQIDSDYFVTRGFQYDFHISRSDTIRLGYPYDTHCRDYFSNIRKYMASDNTSTRVELNRQACLQNCIVKNAINKCNCWPPVMPYYENDELDVNKDLEACLWASSITLFNNNNMSIVVSGSSSNRTENVSTNKYFDCYKIFHRRCHELCPAECKTTQYSVVSERMKWPSDAKLLFDDDNRQAKLLRSCCALITIKFADFQHSVHKYEPRFNLVDLIGNVGGLLALWLGLSIVSVYYTVMKLVTVIKDRRRHKRQIHPQYGVNK